jgi:hypothetical protein
VAKVTAFDATKLHKMREKLQLRKWFMADLREPFAGNSQNSSLSQCRMNGF